MTNDTTAPSTREMLQQLHRLVVSDLTARLQRGPVSAEFLTVARRVLKDNGLAGLATDAADRERLNAIYRAYVERLAEAVLGERPPAAILAEARVFLQAQGVGKDLGATAEQATALHLLADQRVPFKN